MREAVHKRTGARVAVKCIQKASLLADAKFDGVEEIRREVNVMIQMRHPNVVLIKDFGEDADYVYIVMEFCEGGGGDDP